MFVIKSIIYCLYFKLKEGLKMYVQKVRLPDINKLTWLVIKDDYLPVLPIKEYLNYLNIINYSPNTIRSYAYHLKTYWEFLKKYDLQWEKVGLEELVDFVSWLRKPKDKVVSIDKKDTPKRKASTVNTILTCIYSFYDYHAEVKNINLNNADRFKKMPRKFKGFLYHLDKNESIKTKIIKLKTNTSRPKTLTEKQILKIIENCNNLRDKLLVSLVYETGLRIGQALGLRHKDIHSWDNEIHIVFRDNNINGVRSKSTKDNIIHVSEDLMALYTEYLIYEFADIDSDYVFINLWNGKIGKAMSYQNAVDLIKRLSKDLDISVHWHMFRHTHAKKLLTSGWDPAYVQKRLGHKNIQTTINTYGNIDDQDLKDAFNKYINKKE